MTAVLRLGGRRMVLWITAGAAVLASVLVAVLASAGPAAQVSADSPLLGKPAPSISGAGLGGGAVQLSQFAGRWVLINFAASWCVPCQQEMPQLLAFAHDHAGGDATILTVAYDESDLSNLRSFLAGQHATWLAVDDPQAKVDYGIGGIPESYLVDPEGTVVAKYLSGVNAAGLNAFIARFSVPSPAGTGR
jgi:cytochrome c biogenesis protein CcmG/thiol:disulfide interchange protein DsbE